MPTLTQTPRVSNREECKRHLSNQTGYLSMVIASPARPLIFDSALGGSWEFPHQDRDCHAPYFKNYL